MNVSIDMAAIRERADIYLNARRAQGPYNCPVTASECADDVPALIAEIERLNDRIDAAFEALSIDEFGGGYCHTLEDLIGYAVGRYRAVCESEAEAAGEIARLRAEVAAR